jgi:hypothetical protein
MFVSCVYVLSSVGIVRCDGLITSPEESYRVSNVCMMTETPKGAPCSKWERQKNNEWMWRANKQTSNCNSPALNHSHDYTFSGQCTSALFLTHHCIYDRKSSPHCAG